MGVLKLASGGILLRPGGGGLKIPEPLAPPANLSASRSSDYTSTSLSADSVSGASNYKWYRMDLERDTYTLIATTGTPSYTDNHGNPEQTYSYKVAAEDSGGNIGRRSDATHTPGQHSDL